MDKDSYQDMMDALNARSTWESKVSSYYTLRYDGMRRTHKPYKDAPDVHYALVDTVIEKLKPFYIQQLYADEVMAAFVAEDPIPRDQVVLKEQWFDYKMKQCSNFEEEILHGIDIMMHYGTCPFKIYWNEDTKELEFEAVDPMYVLVPQNADKVGNLEWLTQIKVISRAQYEEDANYKQSKDFIDQIVGRGQDGATQIAQKEQSMQQREGLTFSKDKNRIVLWESYEKTKKGWQVTTIAPAVGYDAVAREPFILPYNSDELPFIQLRNEETTKGWYTPRGIAELLMPHELSLCKNWNMQLQFMDFNGHPVYKNSGLAPINATDFSAKPGRILPQGVEPVIATSAPIDFQEQMQFVRALAEDRIQIPDLSAGEHLSGKQGSRGEVTATQVNAVIGLSNQSNDMRSRLFRKQLSAIYNQANDLLDQYASKERDFVLGSNFVQLPSELFGKKYTIHPSGSADSWNKAYRVQKATMKYQLLLGKPNVDQDGLLDMFLMADDPRDIQKLHLNTGMSDSLQGEKQAMELLLMQAGHPATVKPDDKDGIHIQNVDQWLQYQLGKGQPPDAATAGRVIQHVQGHAQAAMQKQDKPALAIVKNSGPMMNMLQSILAQGGSQSPVAGANGQQPAPQGQNGEASAKESIAINYKDAPPSIQRQMEQAAGFTPAVPVESALQTKALAVKAQPKAPPKPPMAVKSQ